MLQALWCCILAAVRPSLSIASACFVTLLLLLWSNACASASEVAPPAPEDGIVDDALLLTNEERAALVSEIQQLRADRGVTLYIHTSKAGLHPSPIGYSRALRKAWLNGKSGMLVSLVVGKTANPSIQLTPDVWMIYSEPRVAAMLRRIGTSIAAAETPQAKLANCVNGLSQNLRELADLRREGETAGNRETLLLAGSFVAVMLLAGLAASLLARRLRRNELSHLETYHFPKVTVQERLGAGLGGGVVVEASWGAGNDSELPRIER